MIWLFVFMLYVSVNNFITQKLFSQKGVSQWDVFLAPMT